MDVIQKLEGILGPKRVLRRKGQVRAYAYDASGEQGFPAAAVFPESTEETAAVARVCWQSGVPMIPRGAATNVCGGTIPCQDAIVISLNRMNKVLSLDSRRRRMLAEVGILNQTVQDIVKPEGLFFAPDPSSQRISTIGGNLAENAGGPHCLKYGVTSDHILGLTLVLWDGQIVKIDSSDPGWYYDITGLFGASEGTFGIATEAILALTPLPEAVETAWITFPSLADAIHAVSSIIEARVIPATLEVMDRPMLEMVERYVHAGYPTDVGAALVAEVDGIRSFLDHDMQIIETIARRCGAIMFHRAHDDAERDKLWLGRRSVMGAMSQLSPFVWICDVTVPRNHLVEMVELVQEIGQHYGLVLANTAHAGDGNLHPLISYHPENPDEVRRLKMADHDILAAAVRFGGTISGEHGIGIEKRNSMLLQWNRAEIELMDKIRSAFDPKNLYNPGKVLPDPRDAEAAPDIQEVEPEPSTVYGVGGITSTQAICPADAREAAGAVMWANRNGVPFIPWGLGRHQNEGLLPETLSLVVDTRSLNSIEINQANLSLKAGAGLQLSQVDEALLSYGLRLPLVPAEGNGSTVGGSLALDRVGPRGYGFGSFKRWTLGLEVVTPTGQVVRTGGQTMKNVAGYDLTKLFVGSRGTLGIITGATFKVIPRPEYEETIFMTFSKMSEADDFAVALGKSAFRPTSLQVADPFMLDQTTPLRVDRESIGVIAAVEGFPEEVAYKRDNIVAMCQASGGDSVSSLSGQDSSAFWDRWYELASRWHDNAWAVAEIWISRELYTGLRHLLEGMEAYVTGRMEGNSLTVYFLRKPESGLMEKIAAIGGVVIMTRLSVNGDAGVKVAVSEPSKIEAAIKSTLDPLGLANPHQYSIPVWHGAPK